MQSYRCCCLQLCKYVIFVVNECDVNSRRYLSVGINTILSNSVSKVFDLQKRKLKPFKIPLFLSVRKTRAVFHTHTQTHTVSHTHLLKTSVTSKLLLTIFPSYKYTFMFHIIWLYIQQLILCSVFYTLFVLNTLIYQVFYVS